LVFVDDSPSASSINGRAVFTYQDFLAAECSSRSICIAIANSDTRQRLSLLCQEDGIDNFAVVAQNAVIMDDVDIGDGAIICPFVTMTANIQVGRFFQANLYSYVAHDCLIGDFVTFAPGVHCNGNVTIGDYAYLGAGCVLRQGQPDEPIVIGRGAVVGMGAVVTRSVPPGVTVVGNPARPLRAP